MLDIPAINTPILVFSRGFKGHLFLRLGRAFGLVPPIEGAMLRHDAPTRTRGDLDSLLEYAACMRHSPISEFSCFLRISLAISSVTTRGLYVRVVYHPALGLPL